MNFTGEPVGLSLVADLFRHLVRLEAKLGNNPVIGTDGLDVRDIVAVCLLADNNSLSMKEMPRLLGSGRGTTDRVIRKLANAGIVDLTGGGSDPSDQVAVLTDHGKQSYQRLEGSWQAWLDRNAEAHAATRKIRSGARIVRGLLDANPQATRNAKG